MEALDRMKEGEGCDLAARLAASAAFNLDEGEILSILKPELYIGRCIEQVETYIEKIRTLLSDTEEDSEQIYL